MHVFLVVINIVTTDIFSHCNVGLNRMTQLF